MKKYGIFFIHGLKKTLAEPGLLIGISMFYSLIVWVCSQIWFAIDVQTQGAVSMKEMVWYVAATEWVLLSIPQIWRDIQTDVRSGNVALYLMRPLSYYGTSLMQALGATFVRLIALGAAGALIGCLITHDWPLGFVDSIIAFCMAFLGCLLIILMHLGTGLLTFWLQEVRPLTWFLGKMLFLFGGLLLPIKLYPSWMQTIARWTPFPLILNDVGQWVSQDTKSLPSFTYIFGVMLWLGIIGLISAVIWKQTQRTLSINGG